MCGAGKRSGNWGKQMLEVVRRDDPPADAEGQPSIEAETPPKRKTENRGINEHWFPSLP